MKTITKDAIKTMMEEERDKLLQEEEPRKTITRTEIKKMMEEEHSKLRAEGLHDEGLKDGVSDYIFDELSGWHDEAKAELQKHVEANGFDLTQEVLQALGSGVDGIAEARKRPLKRDRERFPVTLKW